MSENSPHLLVERHDGVLVLTMNRPGAANALSPEMLLRLYDAWQKYEEDPSLRAAVLTGAGDTDFTAGGDLRLTMPLLTGARQPEDEWDRRLMGDLSQFTDAILRGRDVYKPIIAAVNGDALGGGTEILQTTDIRLAAPHVRFGLPEAKVGLLPGGGSLHRLPNQIPYARAMEMLLVGDPITADEACAFGLVNHVVPAESLMDRAFEFAAKLAANGLLALRKIKEGVLRTRGLQPLPALDIENEMSVAVITSKDAREGPRAFKERRPPRFTGE